MQAEAVDRVVDLARSAKVIEPAPDFKETSRYYIRQADGSYVEEFGEVARNLRFYDTASLAKFLEDVGADAQVFYGSTRIIALVQRSLVTEAHEMKLERHPVFQRLTALAGTEEFGQRQLIRLLRAEFNGHVGDDVIQTFRELKVEASTKGTSVVAQGRESVDRSILDEVQDEHGGAIPEEITVRLPVLDLDESRETLYSIRVLVETTLDSGGHAKFALTAVHNEIRKAEQDAIAAVVASLAKALPKDVPLYHGLP